uniref:Peptidase A2 domain-containing protein n=1 Tax=Caenorhabditis japonica TaxID=281687 RepID=A0A8R1IU62_CAEJA
MGIYTPSKANHRRNQCTNENSTVTIHRNNHLHATAAKGNHWERECWYKDAVCSNCQRKGHIAKACHASRATSPNGSIRTNTVVINHTTSSQNHQPSKRIFKNVFINGQTIRMQLDTGADVTLISQQDWIKLQKPSLHTTKGTLRCVNTHSTVNLKSMVKLLLELVGSPTQQHCSVWTGYRSRKSCMVVSLVVSMLSTHQDWSKAAPGPLQLLVSSYHRMPSRSIKKPAECHLLQSLSSRRTVNAANTAIIKSNATHAKDNYRKGTERGGRRSSTTTKCGNISRLRTHWIAQLRVNIRQLQCQLPHLEDRTCPGSQLDTAEKLSD